MRKTFVWTVISALLVGCVAPPPKYAPEPSLTPQTGATIIGSREENPIPVAPNARNFVMAVDGKTTGKGVFDLDNPVFASRVGDGVFEWDKPVLASPGPHTIQVGRRLSPFGGSVAMQATVEGGKTYVVRGETRGNNSRAILWIEEQGTGRIVGEKVAMCLEHDAPIVRLIDACK